GDGPGGDGPGGGGASGGSGGTGTPQPAPTGSGGPQPSPSSKPGPAEDPAVVAKHLTAPTALAILPDGTALVGERTTGRIVRVQPRPGQPTPVVKTLTGLDASGDGGLLDLAISPNYAEDDLIYAYITTRTDNRVVTFTLNGPVTPVVTGIPKGRTGNRGRLVFLPAGDLLVGTGDAGRPALADDPDSLAGKTLRVTDIGRAAPENPTSSPIFSRGHSEIAGLCVVPTTGTPLDVEPTSSGSGEINVLVAGGDYGYPSPTPDSTSPAASLPTNATSPGGCAVRDTTIFVTSLDAKELLAAPLAGKGSGLAPQKFRVVLKNKYGRLRTVVAAPDGAIWLTTSNKDGRGTPVADDERVIRITGGQVSSNPT
ncbi:MAG: PQQ-dependent sugar dehydrogenase, partial [Jatrophihabitans sp.]|uniref:PQQ-dependent sugar dehydrogenase n=1 Tax=Jatrophihabitans sp. TaxID=1932789 RepID=UPI003F8214E6